ncbi:MAG: TIGR01244 family phosphatase [Halioglobus sp.]|nr:TIGR01244 family phosphatase [Halioglobus sp.]
MKIVRLTEALSVSGQIFPDDVGAVAAQGYQVLINNRPDAEDETQPTGSVIAEAAAAAGLEYHYLPVSQASFPGPDFAALSALLQDTSRSTLAFCRSGTRCANLWVLSVDVGAREGATISAAERGFDMTMASRFIRSAQGAL